MFNSNTVTEKRSVYKRKPPGLTNTTNKGSDSVWITFNPGEVKPTQTQQPLDKMSVAPFLLKTYEIISNPSHAEICGWGENDDSIFITNVSYHTTV